MSGIIMNLLKFSNIYIFRGVQREICDLGDFGGTEIPIIALLLFFPVTHGE